MVPNITKRMNSKTRTNVQASTRYKEKIISSCLNQHTILKIMYNIQQIFTQYNTFTIKYVLPST